MPRLFTITMSRGAGRCSRGPVRGVPSRGRFITIDPATGHAMEPDRDAIRACLPRFYHAAWDRKPVIGKYAGEEDVFYYTLRDVNGRYLNTVYATPYDF